MLYMCICVCFYQGTHVSVRGQLTEVSSLSIMWVLGMELGRSRGFVKNTCITEPPCRPTKWVSQSNS